MTIKVNVGNKTAGSKMERFRVGRRHPSSGEIGEQVESQRGSEGTQIVPRKMDPKYIESEFDKVKHEQKVDFIISGALIFDNVESEEEAVSIERLVMREMGYKPRTHHGTLDKNTKQLIFSLNFEESLTNDLGDVAFNDVKEIAWNLRADRFKLTSVAVKPADADRQDKMIATGHEVAGVERLYERITKSLAEIPASQKIDRKFLKGFLAGCYREALEEMSVSIVH